MNQALPSLHEGSLKSTLTESYSPFNCLKFNKHCFVVSERLSNPNLFIVHNRWDCSAGEDCQVIIII